MKTSQARWPQINIEFRHESIPVATMSPSKIPDEGWRYIDKQGHGHFYDKKRALPTLNRIVTGTTWVGDEYDGLEMDIVEYRCKQCHEVVEPGARLDYGPSSIPGPTIIYLSINEKEFILNEQQWKQTVDELLTLLHQLTGQ